MQTSNPTWQRSNNLAVVARSVWKDPGLSRRDLDKQFLIDKSSISRLVQVLLDVGLVETAGRVDSSVPAGGGRPRVALKVRSGFGQVWGLALWPDSVRLTVLNAAGQTLAVREQQFRTEAGGWPAYLRRALEFATEVAEPLGLPLLGIGFAVPGWIDFAGGRILKSLQFGLEDTTPLEDLSQRLPLLWENDANCGAWSCLSQGNEGANALYVFGRYLDRGALGSPRELTVGCGLVVAGQLHRGHHHRAGEYRSAFWRPGFQSVLGVPDEVLGRSFDHRADFGAVARDLVTNLRSFAELLDPETIYLGGEFKARQQELGEAMVDLGWNEPGLLKPQQSSSDEVSLGAAQLILDELFQLPSSHPRSLFRGYGTGTNDPLWRGVPATALREFIAESLSGYGAR